MDGQKAQEWVAIQDEYSKKRLVVTACAVSKYEKATNNLTFPSQISLPNQIGLPQTTKTDPCEYWQADILAKRQNYV